MTTSHYPTKLTDETGRNVYPDFERQYRAPQPLDAFPLAEEMRARCDHPDLVRLVEQAWDARNTIDATLAEMEAGGTAGKLLGSTPKALAASVRQEASDYAAGRLLDNVGYSGTRRVSESIGRRLEAELRESLMPFADAVVESMRPAFDENVDIVAAAVEQGIGRDTNVNDLITTGTSEQIAAYRALPAATRALEGIALMRDNLSLGLDYGPRDALALAYIAPVATRLELQSALNAYAVELEVGQVQLSTGGGGFITTERQVIGGRWLALLNARLDLRLNTAAEVAALKAQAA